ncbi:flavin reductase family protein [Spirillospora sp. NPDC048819]|uniref:flavin reductase family protein n=1 Tax=Spirillospora sp. NPDC048819 TaxID=3155268 RepID=UPI0033E80D3F
MVTDQAFRDLMAGVCAPVTIVTAAEGGRPHGTTVSAFASLSLRPPMVTVALDHGSALLERIRRTGRFGVNVLGHGQDDDALVFAKRDVDRFAAVEWGFDHELPRLVRSPGWLACDLARELQGGDHILLLGIVIAAETRTAAPLVYGHRAFGTHSGFADRPRRPITDVITACSH